MNKSIYIHLFIYIWKNNTTNKQSNVYIWKHNVTNERANMYIFGRTIRQMNKPVCILSHSHEYRDRTIHPRTIRPKWSPKG